MNKPACFVLASAFITLVATVNPAGKYRLEFLKIVLYQEDFRVHGPYNQIKEIWDHFRMNQVFITPILHAFKPILMDYEKVDEFYLVVLKHVIKT